MNSDLFDLKGKTAVITGGGGVLCGSMALHLAHRGVKAAVLDRRLDAAEAVAANIESAGGVAMPVECDVLVRGSLEAARDRVLKAYGSVDILLNGAGGNSPAGTTSEEVLSPDFLERHPEGRTSFFDLDPEGFRFVLDLNLLGAVLPTQVFAAPMAAAGRGVVVNVSSMNAFRPLTKIPAYSAAKAAVSNFTQWLAVHLAPAGVRVNALAPGFFLTDQNRFLLTDAGTGELTARGHKIVGHTPMGRFGDAADLHGTLVWLCSDASAFVTGVVVPVDGGFSAYSGV